MRVSGVVGSLTALGMVLASCGTGTPARQLRPNAPTYAEASGSATCRVVENYGEPFVVDWRPEQRADLEIALREGIAVVHYDCHGLRLLKNCHADGSYGFLGTVRKEQVIRLRDEDEITANFPVGGSRFAASLSGDLKRGATLDVALVIVGKRSTTRATLPKEQLQGDCSDATHFVRRATVGAFSMQTGTAARVRAAAELFSATTGATSSSAREQDTKDGSIDACRTSNVDGEKPPDQCGAILRVELTAVGAPAAEDGREETCPRGLKMVDGRCAVPKEGDAFDCWPELSKCEGQCERGNAKSCWLLGRAYEEPAKEFPYDPKRAAELYRRACDGDYPAGCAYLGYAYYSGIGVALDRGRAEELYRSACGRGLAGACSNLASLFQRLDKNNERARPYYRRACDGGFALACSSLGGVFETDGKHQEALDMLKRACPGDSGMGCFGLAEILERGRLAPRDEKRAAKLYEATCNEGLADGCTRLARMVRDGRGEVKAVPNFARDLFAMACEKGSTDGCFELGYTLKNGIGSPRDEKAALGSFLKACKLDDRRACAEAGLMVWMGQGVSADPAAGRDLLEKACELGESNGCGALGVNLLQTGKTTRERFEGRGFLEKACGMKNAQACADLKKLPGR